jgi:anti-anti-sigma factor
MSTSEFPSSQSSSSRNGPQAAEDEDRALFVRCTVSNSHVIARIVTPSIGQRESPIITNQVSATLNEVGSELRSLVIDFTEVGYINSMGIGMCIELRNRANAHGAKQVVLYHLQPDILHVLKMTRIDKVFTVIDKEAKLEKLLAK